MFVRSLVCVEVRSFVRSLVVGWLVRSLARSLACLFVRVLVVVSSISGLFCGSFARSRSFVLFHFLRRSLLVRLKT